MMENLGKKPAKGILKTKSIEQSDPPKPGDIKWDEMNILQTLHPPDKDYGFMKIDEPKTPYSYEASDEADGGTEVKPVQADQLDSEALARKISAKDRRLSIDDSACTSGDDEDDEQLTEEEKLRKKEFEMKRKSHYNEFQAVKLARQLLEEEDEDEEEEDKERDTTNNSATTAE